MPKVCLLIAASPNDGFFSQIAAIGLALERLAWTRWQYRIVACFGGDVDPAVLAAWRPHLRHTDMVFVSAERFADEAVWAQSDDVFRFAPRDADVLLAMDADTLPVAGFEDVLDDVLAAGSVAGVTAHFSFPPYPGLSNRDSWLRAAEGLVERPLAFDHVASLSEPSMPEDRRQMPFYLNFGVVFFARPAFEAMLPIYLDLRPRLMAQLPVPVFAGQVALTLAVCEAGVPVRALPMRYNFPNDARAVALHPDELDNAVVFHYLRTERFDRQRIFTTPQTYLDFLALPLEGADLVFQQAVRRLLGDAYPFAAA